MLNNEFNFEYSNDSRVDIGYDFNLLKTYTDEFGVALDLTSQTLQLIVKDALGGSSILTLSTVGSATVDGIYIPTPSNGEYYIQITDTTTTGLTAGIYPYVLERTDANSRKFILLQGTFEIYDRGF